MEDKVEQPKMRVGLINKKVVVDFGTVSQFVELNKKQAIDLANAIRIQAEKITLD